MGQRLNIEIKENNELLANALYQWSGFTSASLVLTQCILDNVENIKYDDPVAKAIKLLECTGAGMTDWEMVYGVKNIKDFDSYHFKHGQNRNEGFISISPEGMAYNEEYEDIRVEIHLDTRIVKFHGVYQVSEEKAEDWIEYDVDLDSIRFEDFSKIKDDFLNFMKKGISCIKLKNKDVIYEFTR